MKLLSTLVIVLVLITSCKYDGLFLYPNELQNNEVIRAYSAEHGDSVSIQFNNTQPEFLTDDNEELPLNFTIKSINFENSRGDTLNSWLIEPKSGYNGKMIYFLHGNAGNVLFQYRLVTPFAEKGYKIFMIDYSGFGFSQGEHTRKNVLLDGNEGFEYLKSRTDLEYDKLFIYGQSLGGHLSAVVANTYQDDIDGLVVEGGFSSHKNVAATRMPVLPYFFMQEMYSGKDSIGLIQKPVLVVHSREDKTVKYKLGQKLYANATEPKSFYAIDSCHICGPLYYLDSIVYRMDDMIK